MTDKQKDLLREYVALKPQPRELGLAIEAALKEVEALEKLIQWAKDRVHHESDGKDFYYRGVGAACRAILDRTPETPNDEQTA